MDKKSFKFNKSGGQSNKRRGFKNAGFVAIIVLLLLIVIAAYALPNNLK